MIKRLKTDIFIHKINKDGKPSKRGTEFGSKPWHAKTPEEEVARLEKLNPGVGFVIVRK